MTRRHDRSRSDANGNGNRRRAYTHYPGIDQPHSVREFTGTHAGRYYFAMELPGHVIGLLNASGARVNHYGYTAFGKPEHVYETVPNSLRYMAREWDPDAGLYYVRNRWYDPEVGRFISEDPIGLAGGINVYAYAANDPVNARDPYGLLPCTWHTVRVEFSTGEVGTVKVFSPGCADGLAPTPSDRGSGWARAGGDGAAPQPARQERQSAIQQCYDGHRFSSLFGDGTVGDVIRIVEIGSGVSLGLDAIAISQKRAGFLGSSNFYAGGVRMIGKDVARFVNRPDALPAIIKVGDRITPALALVGAFTLAYNTTTDLQCRLGVIE